MKSTMVTLLCLGMVSANFFSRLLPGNQVKQPVPPPTPVAQKNQPKADELKIMDCTKVKCAPEFYRGMWSVKFADPTVTQNSACKTLRYGVGVIETYAGGHAREAYVQRKMDPDQYRVIYINELCNGKSLLLKGTGAPVKNGVAFRLQYELPASNEVIGVLQFEKLWITSYGVVVAAMVKHPFAWHNPARQFLPVRSLWYDAKVLAPEEVQKIAVSAFGARVQ